MGPMVTVRTVVAGINLDVGRLLNMGPDKTLKFMVPDTTQMTNWRTELTVVSGFNRITGHEKTSGDGSEVIFKIADPNGTVRPKLALKDLHVEVEGLIYQVGQIPPVASSETQVFTLTCKQRTLRTQFDNAKK